MRFGDNKLLEWRIDATLLLFLPKPIIQIVKLLCAQTWEELKEQFESAHPHHGSSFSPYFWPERYKDQTGLLKDLSERMIPRFAWLYPTNTPTSNLEEMRFEMLDIALHQKRRYSSIRKYAVLLLYVGDKPRKHIRSSGIIAQYQAVRLEDVKECRQWLGTACGYLFEPGSLYPFSWFGKKTRQYYQRQKRALRRKCDVYKSVYA